ncbi:glycosyl hydrolase family 28 protein [Fusibacter bizertensis]
MLSKKIENSLLFVMVGIIIILTVVLIIPQKPREENALAESKLKLYDGPKSIRLATEEDLKATSEQLRDFSLLRSFDTIIKVNGQDSFVYETNVNHTRQWVSTYLPPISRTPITYFDFEGVAKIEVTVPGQALDSVTISPASYHIIPNINLETKTITFEITHPDTYTITFDGSPERAVHIFANAMETDLPNFDDENVIYIGPGEWDVDTIVLKDNQTLYIAGGAVVHGIVQANFAKNVKVMGRGIVDGSFYDGWKGKVAYIPLKFDNCEEVTIKDLIILNANAWVCQAFQSKNGVIDGLKIISPRPNGDGITLQSCENYEVKNCFVRSWDDSLVVKNYGTSTKDITFSNCQLWTDLAQSMEIGYETNKGKIENATILNVTFEKMTVLSNFHKPVISIHNGDDAVISNILFKDITIENAQMGSGDGEEFPYLIDFHIGQSSNWSSTKERGVIRDVTVSGVNVLAGKFNASRIKGYDTTHRIENVQIIDLTILGQKIVDPITGKFEIDAQTTDQIIFK